jgi:DNA-binding transcriptional regulator YdaS (Cro superfamily)
MTENLHLLRALELLGTQQAMADAIGIKQQTVSEVIRGGGAAPAKWCIPLEIATGGKVTRHQLRPDLYPIEHKRSPKSHHAAE